MIAAALAALAAAAAPADVRQGEVEGAVFDICPRAMAGSVSLDDAAQATALGYTLMEPRQTPAGPNPRVARGTGTDRIVISIGGETGRRVCSVWFGGPNNRRLANAIRSMARSSGYRDGGSMRLGDGVRVRAFRRPDGEARTLIMFDADAGGELDFEPATTVVLMTGAE